ncbi:MAG: SRPBCC domain-containing protein [Ornithinimicrobium sp.]
MSDDNGGQNLVIERTLQAPPDLIWKMWTEPEHFAAWYGPDGATIPSATMDVRVGGIRLVCMEVTTPDGTMQMWFTGEYLEVVENQRLVYTDSMSDENGTVKTPEQVGMPEGHPTTTEVTVEIEEVTAGTKMVLTHVGVPAESPGAAGWAMALDKLAAHLAEAQRG